VIVAAELAGCRGEPTISSGLAMFNDLVFNFSVEEFARIPDAE
jgi:hypothetical protein